MTAGSGSWARTTSWSGSPASVRSGHGRCVRRSRSSAEVRCPGSSTVSRSRSCAARWPADGRPGRRDDPHRIPGSSAAVGVELLGVDRLGDHHDGNGTPRAGAVVAFPARKRRSESPISGDPGMCGRMGAATGQERPHRSAYRALERVPWTDLPAGAAQGLNRPSRGAILADHRPGHDGRVHGGVIVRQSEQRPPGTGGDTATGGAGTGGAGTLGLGDGDAGTLGDGDGDAGRGAARLPAMAATVEVTMASRSGPPGACGRGGSGRGGGGSGARSTRTGTGRRRGATRGRRARAGSPVSPAARRSDSGT